MKSRHHEQLLTADLTSFMAEVGTSIPLVPHLGIQSLQWEDPRSLLMSVRLSPLVNDKGTGFGGGLNALSTLLGWCFMTLQLRAAGCECPVVVSHHQTEFVAPVTDDFVLRCQPQPEASIAEMLARVKAKGRGRLMLTMTLDQGAQCCLRASGRYVALAAP
ncbi:hypothetical protein BFW38_10460 [Terasakiispira papahanaumokuakeensis]|uniref:Thioesterase putative domain-containing protein n=1 Tax=Terasakiispira papahanaumokuakeensis TaxID=197479 RepID=A0A1E2VAE9_9GAMM|nr:YiiD C-terminal domain-containing protein [Terasakiispira papahanaumokuakeensis]ODC03903.1 hypothetical protein BFW38_10460 [Terasakiispira papahanaumokuakeensis]